MKRHSLSIFNNVFSYNWKTFRGITGNLGSIPRGFKWAWQRVFKGYADCDIWNFDSYLANLISAGLRDLTTGISYPLGFKSGEEWHDWLNKTADMFDVGFDDDWWDRSPDMTREEQKAEAIRRRDIGKQALERFAERFEDFWD